MEARSRRLERRAAKDAELERAEANYTEATEAFFKLPTAEEREKEKASGGPDVQEVQMRMAECVKVLNDFKNLAAEGRYVGINAPSWRQSNKLVYRSRSEYVEQLISDIASYYGYNEFLAEKLFDLFSVSEVCGLAQFSTWDAHYIGRRSNSLRPTSCLGR